ncbi:unnamed protein product [Orchesella dallaii]|uniref:Uncharacterized protein n=1 Tax=Orchesella dallaii TaxID=48710 RepID=A0ABP1R7T5_9HEXA
MSKSGAKTEMDRLRLGSVLGKIRLDIWNDKKMILNIHSNIMEKYPFNMQLYHDMKTNLDSFLMTSGGGSDVSRVQNRLNEMEEDDILKIHLGIADLETKCMERFALMEEAWNVTVFSEEVDTMTDLKIKELCIIFLLDETPPQIIRELPSNFLVARDPAEKVQLLQSPLMPFFQKPDPSFGYFLNKSEIGNFCA